MKKSFVSISFSFSFAKNITRFKFAFQLKLKKVNYKTRSRLNYLPTYLSNRIFDTWNNLTEEVIAASSTNEFKNRLDNFWFGTIRLSNLFVFVKFDTLGL